jgi:hypothetical protein
MVIKREASTNVSLTAMSAIIRVYIAVVLATIVVLAILSATASHEATQEAWVHAVIVAVFAVVLPLRLRSARAGNVGGLRAVGLIAAALFLVNVVEAMIRSLFPLWMRIQMIAIAVLMLGVVLLVVRERLAGHAALRHS